MGKMKKPPSLVGGPTYNLKMCVFEFRNYNNDLTFQYVLDSKPNTDNRFTNIHRRRTDLV